MFAHAPRPDPRYPELPEALKEPWYGVAATQQTIVHRLFALTGGPRGRAFRPCHISSHMYTVLFEATCKHDT